MMMKEKKRVPMLRFEGFEGEWEEKTLEEISRDVAYGMNAAATTFDGENQYLRITDIDENSRTFLPSPLSSPEGEISDKFILKKGDIVFARTGASVGKSYLYNENDGKLLFAGFLIRFNIHKANPYFIFQQTFLEAYNKWVLVYSMRSGQPGLNAEEYKQLAINLPQLEEQQKIATFLTSIDTRIQQLEKKRTLLEQYKKGVMQQLFKQEIRFKDQDGKEFSEWESVRLKDVLKRSTLKNTKGEVKSVLTNSATQGIVYQSDYFDKDIANQSNLQGYYIVEVDDFIYNPRISQFAPVGPFKRNKLGQGVMSPLYTVLKPVKGNLNFLEYYFETTLWHKYMKSIANYGARHDRMNILISDFEKLPVLYPSLPEQTKIAHFLTSLDRKIAVVDEQIEGTKEWKKGLLQRMFV